MTWNAREEQWTPLKPVRAPEPPEVVQADDDLFLSTSIRIPGDDAAPNGLEIKLGVVRRDSFSPGVVDRLAALEDDKMAERVRRVDSVNERIECWMADSLKPKVETRDDAEAD